LLNNGFDVIFISKLGMMIPDELPCRDMPGYILAELPKKTADSPPCVQEKAGGLKLRCRWRNHQTIAHRIHGAGIYANIWGILMGSMLPYIAAPWILWVAGGFFRLCHV